MNRRKFEKIREKILEGRERGRRERKTREDKGVQLLPVPERDARPAQPSGPAVDKFVQGAISRVGGRYCTPPGPGCTDCSGLVAEEYKKSTGRTITGSSYHQYDLCTPISPGEVKAGDLLFHHTFGGPVNGNLDSHVGIAINDSERVDAMNPDLGITRGPRNRPYWYTTFTRAGRLPW